MFEIIVPATSANLGPGFDSLGLALSLSGRFVFRPAETDPSSHLTLQAYQKTLAELNRSGPTLSVTTPQEIPIGKGLGSSAACIVAGILAAEHVMQQVIPLEQKLALAARIEGHPDNTTPAILGGLVASGWQDDKLLTGRLALSDKLAWAVLIPQAGLATKKARAVLAREVSFQDATYNLAQLALSISALAGGEEDLIRQAFGDRLHQPKRLALIPQAEQVMALAKQHGALAVMLSGAGPSLLLIRRAGDELTSLGPALKGLSGGWRLELLEMSQQGARLSLE